MCNYLGSRSNKKKMEESNLRSVTQVGKILTSEVYPKSAQGMLDVDSII